MQNIDLIVNALKRVSKNSSEPEINLIIQSDEEGVFLDAGTDVCDDVISGPREIALLFRRMADAMDALVHADKSLS